MRREGRGCFGGCEDVLSGENPFGCRSSAGVGSAVEAFPPPPPMMRPMLPFVKVTVPEGR